MMCGNLHLDLNEERAAPPGLVSFFSLTQGLAAPSRQQSARWLGTPWATFLSRLPALNLLGLGSYSHDSWLGRKSLEDLQGLLHHADLVGPVSTVFLVARKVALEVAGHSQVFGAL
jgi:hypothetical protein